MRLPRGAERRPPFIRAGRGPCAAPARRGPRIRRRRPAPCPGCGCRVAGRTCGTGARGPHALFAGQAAWPAGCDRPRPARLAMLPERSLARRSSRAPAGPLPHSSGSGDARMASALWVARCAGAGLLRAAPQLCRLLGYPCRLCAAGPATRLVDTYVHRLDALACSRRCAAAAGGSTGAGRSGPAAGGPEG